MKLFLFFSIIYINVFASDFSGQLELIEQTYTIDSKISPINLNNIILAGEKFDEVKIAKLEAVTEVKKDSTNGDDEMLFFSYDTSVNTKQNNSEITNLPKTNTKNVAPKVAVTAKSSIKLPPNMDQVDYSQFIASSMQRTVEKNFSIVFYEINKKGIEKNRIKEVDLFPAFDSEEIFTDYGTGEVKLPITQRQKNLNFKATIGARNVMRTNFEIAPQSDEVYEIPIFEQELFDEIVSNEIKNENYGSYLLIDLGDSLDTVSIDAKFAKKIYLDNKFRIAKNDTEYRYEFFLDVRPGNTLVRFMDLDGNISEKIVSLIRGELTYESPVFVKEKYIEFELVEENLLSKRNQIIELDEKKIKYFNLNKTAEKIGINRYRIKAPKREESFRQYLEIDYGSKVYVGFNESEKLKLPGEDFIPYIKNGLGISDDSGSCLLQVNLTNPLKEFKARSISDKEIGSTQIYYMDKDGTVSRELTGLTEKVFINSQDFGSINIRTKNNRNEIEYYQSFCTDSLYLIENI